MSNLLQCHGFFPPNSLLMYTDNRLQKKKREAVILGMILHVMATFLFSDLCMGLSTGESL